MRADVKYSAELGIEICTRLAQGESLSSICKSEGMPSKSAVVMWAANPEHPISEHYARAREVGYRLLADEIIEISDTPLMGVKTKTGPNGTEVTEGDMIEHRRLQIDSRKWMLSKMLPKIYGDKLEVKQQIGFTEEFEKFVRELKGMTPPKVIDGLARSGGAVEVQPVELRSGSDLQADRGNLAAVDTGNTKT